MARILLRRYWLQVHRWLGLSLGLVLLCSGLTGALLLLGDPLDEAVNSQLFDAAQPVPDTVVLDPLLQQLRAEFGPGAAFTLRPPRDDGESLRALVAAPAWRGVVFFDAASGRELGRRGERDGFFNLLFELHSELLSGEIGKRVLALTAAAYVLMLLSGVVLWWPARWRQALSIKTAAGLTRALFDLHRLGGVLLGLLVLVAVASGAYMAYRPISAWVSAAAGDERVLAPKLAATVDGAHGVDGAVERARALFPDGVVGYAQVPAAGTAPLRIRLRLPDDPHPNGLTSVWLNPHSHEVLAVHRWSALDAGSSAYSYIYPLHIGALGGALNWIGSLLAGAALALLGGSGVWLWWRRRRGVR